jgi:xylose dehydrogenase (NAD/NADP)
MSSDTVRYGIISTAAIAINQHIPAALESHNSEIVAISSRTDDRAQKAANSNGIERWYGTYKEMLADADIDAVINPLPNSMHHEWTIKAAEAGKHILCEKPLAVTMTQAREMIAAADANGVLLTEAFTHRLNPQMRRIRQLVAEGGIGNVQSMEAVTAFRVHDPENNNINKPELAGGVIWDAGSYAVSAARFILSGEPVTAIGYTIDSAQYGVPIALSGLLEFPGGAIAHLHCGHEQPRTRYLEVVGTKGRIRLPDIFAEDVSLTITDSDGVERIEDFAGQGRFVVQLNSFSDCILNGKTLEFPPIDGLRNTAALLALYDSAEFGQVTAVEQA